MRSSRQTSLEVQRPLTWKLEEVVLSYLENGSLPPLLSPSLPPSFALKLKSRASPEVPKRVRWINKLDDTDSPKFLLRIFLPKNRLGKTGGAQKHVDSDKIVGLGIDSKNSSRAEVPKNDAVKHEVSKSDGRIPKTVELSGKNGAAVKPEVKNGVSLKSETKNGVSLKSEVKNGATVKSETKNMTTKCPATINAETADPAVAKAGSRTTLTTKSDAKNSAAVKPAAKHQPNVKAESTSKNDPTIRNDRCSKSPPEFDPSANNLKHLKDPLSPLFLANLKSLWLNRSKATKAAAELHRKDNELLYCIMQVDSLLMRILSSIYDEHYRRKTAASPSERPWMTLEQDMGRLVVEIERQAVEGAPHAIFMRTVLLLMFQAKAAVLYRVNNILKLIVDDQLATLLSDSTRSRISELNEMAVDNYERATEYCAASDPCSLLGTLPSTFPQTWKKRAANLSETHAQVMEFPIDLNIKLVRFYFPFGPYTAVLEVVAALHSILSEYGESVASVGSYQPLNERG